MNHAKIKRIIARSAEILAALLVLLLIAVGVSVFVCSRYIKTTHYDVSLDGITNPVRLVIVADTHGKVFGKDNEQLYEKVAAQQPDVIVLLGDLFPAEFSEADKAYVVDMTKRMQSIAQVFFAMGNHENSYTLQYGGSWIGEIRETGALVFDESWDDLELGGNTIRFGGTLGHGFPFGRTDEEYEASPEYAVFTALETSPYPSVLLAHMPDTVVFETSKTNWHFDLVLSGHTHGGVIRFPGIGGLYAPIQEWWPPYDYGDMMLNERMRLIITSGLSGHGKVPRIFNLPEIAVIDLQP